MPTIKFLNDKKSVEVPAGTNLRKAARENGVQLYGDPLPGLNCMGLGSCGRCCVYVKKGVENVSRMGIKERLRWLLRYVDVITLGKYAGHENEARLACQTRVNGDIEVETRVGANAHGEKFWG